MTQKVLSCSVFQARDTVYWRNDRTGDRMSAYVRFLPILVRAFHALWPGWELRIHHDDAVRAHPYMTALGRMHERGLLRMVPCGPVPALCLAMLWRLRPAFEDGDRIVLTHDIDSLPVLRLRRMGDEFAASGKAVMIVHACESHDGVMGGGIGVRSSRFRELLRCGSWDEFVRMAGNMDWNAYASDEDYQRRTVWPMVRHDAIMYRNEPKPSTIPCDDVRPEPAIDPPSELLPSALAHGNAFAPYIGSAGYDMAGAWGHYNGLDLPAVRAIGECESGIDVNAVLHP